MSPVHLRLFAGQATQPQIRLGLRTRPMAGDQVAEVIGAAAIAALAHHPIQPTGGQRRERLQRLADERQIRVDLRRPRRRADPGQPGLRQHARHHAVMHVQLTGDGADAPLLDVVVAQDLRLDVRRRDHARVLSGRVASGRDGRGGGAGTPGGRMPGSGDRTSGSARPFAGAAPPGWLRRPRSPASRAPADHPAAARVNRDASLSCRAPDSDASDRHARAAPGGWSGNAVRQHAARGAGRVRRSLRHSRSGRDRSSCRSRLWVRQPAHRNSRADRNLVMRGPAGATWTNATIAGILALHACPARCGARRRCGTAKLGSAPCLPLRAGTLLRHSSPRQAAHAPQRLIAPDDTSSPIQQSRTCLSASASRRPLSPHQFRHSAPDMRGSAQPSTVAAALGRSVQEIDSSRRLRSTCVAPHRYRPW